MSVIYSVHEITAGIRSTLEESFPFVWVRGQVSNLSRPSSGHIYFSIKDEYAQLACVWFQKRQRNQDKFDPLTGEVYDENSRPNLAQSLYNGQEVLCAGRVTVYEARGVYQLVVELVQDAGLGALQMQFEALKQKLQAQGWFDASRKRPLPIAPKRVAVVTAPTGAAIHDFLRLAEERGTGANIRIYPSLVQGDAAPVSLVNALKAAKKDLWTNAEERGAHADVIVLIRGGGSLEDLWAFNDERVAAEILSSPMPVITGIGHEVDTSIADLVADVRAATPSHVAPLLWQERNELRQRLDDMETGLMKRWEQYLTRREHSLAQYSQALRWFSPLRSLERIEERLHLANTRVHTALQNKLSNNDAMLTLYEKRLRQAFAGNTLALYEEKLQALSMRLPQAGMAHLERADRILERVTLQLDAQNPMQPLERGYSLVQREDGSFLRSVDELVADDMLTVLVRDGSARVQTKSVHKNT